MFNLSYMDVSKNRGTPKWMVKIMENPIFQWMIWGETHYFRKHLYVCMYVYIYKYDVFSMRLVFCLTHCDETNPSCLKLVSSKQIPKDYDRAVWDLPRGITTVDGQNPAPPRMLIIP